MLKRLIRLVVVITALSHGAAWAQDAERVLRSVEEAMGTTQLTSLQYTGSGTSAMFGQGLSTGTVVNWVLTNYAVDAHYDAPAMRIVLDRVQTDGVAPFGGGRQTWVFRGDLAWNVGANGMPAPVNYRPDTQMASLEERQLQLWLTPPGFVKAARQFRATTRTQGANRVIVFKTAAGNTVTGTVNRDNLIERIEAIVDHPVLGDMAIDTVFRDYRSFGAVRFPASIVQKHGGFTTLALTVSAVQPNGAAPVAAPDGFTPPAAAPQKVDAQSLAPGVWYLAGGSHHSVLIEFADHVALVDAPNGDARTNAVLAEIRRLVPNKPLRYLIQSHHHFDHAGGTRAAAAEVQTMLVTAGSREYWETVLQRPRTIRPDALAKATRRPTVEPVLAKRVLSDSTRTVELHVVPVNGHVDELMLIYLPRERVLIEADAYTPAPPNAPAAPRPNPWTVALFGDVQRLKLDVERVAPLHGRVVPMADFQRSAGAAPPTTN